MPALFLIKSRHRTTFHFRRRVPLDLVPQLGKTHITCSLQTDSLQLAQVRARAAAATTDAAFEHIRTMSDSNPIDNDKLIKAVLRRKFQLKQLEVNDAQRALEDARELQEAHLRKQAKAHEEAIEALKNAHALELQSVKQRAAITILKNRETAPSMPTPTPPSPATPTITEIWCLYKDEKITTRSWKDGENTAKYDHWPHVRELISVVGDKPIGDVMADDINRFLSHVLTDPSGGSPRNRDKRLTRSGALFRWAKKKRIISDGFTELFQYPGKIEDNPYVAFTPDDLKALFKSDHYRNGAFKTPSEYWLPLLGLHTGARLNELCQLTVEDIAERDGVTTISILDDDENKRLKTTSSRRIIPIHSNLIKCGLLDYVRTIGKGRIFPELPEDPARPGNFAPKASEWFTDYRRACGVGELEERSNKAFHSFRSTLISALRKADVPGDRRRRLAGHEATDVHDRNYTGGDVLTMFNFTTLKSDIEKAKFDINVTPYRSQ